MNTEQTIQLNIKFKHIILFAAIATGIAGAAIAIYAFNTFGNTRTLDIGIISDRNKLSSEEIIALTNKVSEIAVLPEEELPSVLTVTDVTQLKGNPFFVNTHVRDKIIIYKKAGKIIIYDPEKHRIVNMGPYSAATDNIQPSPTPFIQNKTDNPQKEATEESSQE